MNKNSLHIIAGIILLGVVYISQEQIERMVVGSLLTNEIVIDFPSEVTLTDGTDTVKIDDLDGFLDLLDIESDIILDGVTNIIVNTMTSMRDRLKFQSERHTEFDPGLFERNFSCSVGVTSSDADIMLADTQIAQQVSREYVEALKLYSMFGLTTRLRTVSEITG